MVGINKFMIELKPLQKIPESGDIKIFLAGSIEMGTAEHWQDKVAQRFKDQPVTILNPRRDNWDNSWQQSKDNPDFKQQVEWELNALARSDYIIMYFDPVTKSPISLLEMGLYAKSGKLLVVCPEGFWRKGNVDIVCETYGAKQFQTLGELVNYLTALIISQSR